MREIKTVRITWEEINDAADTKRNSPTGKPMIPVSVTECYEICAKIIGCKKGEILTYGKHVPFGWLDDGWVEVSYLCKE